MIEASFATQYGIRLSEMYGTNDMPYPEFCRLLKGISNKTPLGNIVLIRAEENKDMLKHFTPEQKRIRSEWRRNHSRVAEMTDKEKEEAEKGLQKIFAQMFGGGQH